MNNRLYCTFAPEEDVNGIVDKIKTSYSILFNKIFVLESLDGEKVMLTYNVDMGNSSSEFSISTLYVSITFSPSKLSRTKILLKSIE
jgi:hypothetical protein